VFDSLVNKIVCDRDKIVWFGLERYGMAWIGLGRNGADGSGMVRCGGVGVGVDKVGDKLVRFVTLRRFPSKVCGVGGYGTAGPAMAWLGSVCGNSLILI
jgi:hypothetical protein